MMQYKTNKRTNTLNPGTIEHKIATTIAPITNDAHIFIICHLLL